VELVLRDAEIYRQLLSGTPHFAQCSQGQAAGPAPVSGVTLRDGALVTRRAKSTPGE